MARVAAGAFGFLIFNHAFDGPDLYGALSFFETMPSGPRLLICELAGECRDCAKLFGGVLQTPAHLDASRCLLPSCGVTF